MIVEDTFITVTADQAERRVQDLRIGDSIFNPFTGSCDAIVDILTQEFAPGAPQAEGLWPKVIPACSLAPGRPRRDLILSPAQVVMTLRKSAPASDTTASSVPIAVEMSVEMLTSITKPADRPVRYFAIFFDEPRFVDTSGVLSRAFARDDLARVQAG